MTKGGPRRQASSKQGTSPPRGEISLKANNRGEENQGHVRRDVRKREVAKGQKGN